MPDEGEQFEKDFEAMIIQVFNEEPIESQPRYIAQLGDANFLALAFNIIKEKTSRGKQLSSFPLSAIVICPNQDSVDNAKQILKDVPNNIILGDLENVTAIKDKFKDNNVDDTQSILYLNILIDTKNPNSPPTHAVADFDKPTLKKYFSQCKELIGKNNMILIANHYLSSELTSENGLIAEEFILTCALVGLIPNSAYAKRYPDDKGYTRITLNQMESSPYTIRHPITEDLSALLEIEIATWLPHLQVSEDEIKRRIQEYLVE